MAAIEYVECFWQEGNEIIVILPNGDAQTLRGKICVNVSWLN